MAGNDFVQQTAIASVLSEIDAAGMKVLFDTF